MVSGHDSEVRGPGAHSPSRSNKSSPCSSPTHPHGSGSSISSPAYSSNGFISNGVQNGVRDEEDILMEIEEESRGETSTHGVLNGSSSQDKISNSPRRGNWENSSVSFGLPFALRIQSSVCFTC